jgi:uncharacterized coiled-coil DUF342 family protein
MINKILLTEKQSLIRLRMLTEQYDDSDLKLSDEYYKITPEEYEEIMKLSGYHGQGVTKIKKFGGKPLWITGNVDLSRTPTDSLGNVVYIDGRLDISSTQVKDLGNVKVKGHIWDGGSPREKIRVAKELRERKDALNDDRINKTRDLNNPLIDEEDVKAAALFEWLVNNGDVNDPTDEEKQEIDRLTKELDDLNIKYEESDNPDEYNQLYDRISEIEDELEDLRPSIDVYDIDKNRGNFYGLLNFEVLDPDFRGQEYTVGTYSEMDDAALEYAENYIDDVGLDGFNAGYINNYIDEDEVRRYAEDMYEHDIWESPESYFDDDDWELTEEQEKRKEQLEEYIETLEELKSETEDEQNELENEIEDPDEYSQKYDELQSKIDEIDGNIEKAQNELDELEPDKDNPTQDMVDKKLEERIRDVLYDPASWIKDYGLEIKDFVDKNELAKGLIDDDGWGIMNGYDGNYDSISINNETYYIMRIN